MQRKPQAARGGSAPAARAPQLAKAPPPPPPPPQEEDVSSPPPLSEWERKVARSIARKEERRREELGPAALPILPTDVCRPFLAGECPSSAEACPKAHRVPAEFHAFVAKAKRQGGAEGAPLAAPVEADVKDPIPSTKTTRAGTAGRQRPPDRIIEPTVPPTATSDTVVVVAGIGLLLGCPPAALHAHLGPTVAVVPAKELPRPAMTRVDVVVVEAADRKAAANILRAAVATATAKDDDDPLTGLLGALGAPLPPRVAGTVRLIVVALGAALDGVVLGALPCPIAEKEGAARLVAAASGDAGGPAAPVSTAALFDPVSLVLPRALEIAAGVPARAVLPDAPTLRGTFADSTTAAGDHGDGFLALWCGATIAVDERDTDERRAARAVGNAIRASQQPR